jgi:hypothetical protein
MKGALGVGVQLFCDKLAVMKGLLVTTVSPTLLLKVFTDVNVTLEFIVVPDTNRLLTGFTASVK